MTHEDKPLVKFIRLQNGDDIIADVSETEDGDGTIYTLFHPLKVVYMPVDNEGSLSVAFIPWVFSKIVDEQVFILHDEDILIYTDVAEKMNIYYWNNVELTLNKPHVEEEIQNEEIEDDYEPPGKRTLH
jgi:hypothetical protein